MKILRFLISASVCIALTIVLNTKFGMVPPLGKFFDPVNGFWANAESSLQIPEHLQIPGLKEEVKVLYDDMLVPHIFAQNDEDLFLAVGYVHAYHRLWQMEFQTHFAAGRISEIIGPLTLDLDRGQRRKGMVRGAQVVIDNLDETSKIATEQYARGVNYFIDGLSSRNYPLEYKLLGYSPEKWEPLKSGLMYKFMSDDLNSFEKDLENTNFRSIYGKEMLDLIYPDVDNYADPVVDKPGGWSFTPLQRIKSDSIENPDQLTTFNLLPKSNSNNGSNNWAVGPGRSATGNPILCNDIHLTLYIPSLWFYAQLHTNDMNVFGHTLPGIPFVITGFTDSIAWGTTNAQRDLVDWYLIEFEGETRSRYVMDGEYVDVEKVIEEIKIKGEETYYDTVVYTVFGPVTYDNSFRAKSQKNGYARRWIDLDPSEGFMTFYKLGKAKNFNDYMDALDHYTSPAQNFVFASSQGDIAHRVQGKYPLKSFEEGKFLLDGTKSENNWTQFIPNEHNPFWKNPERGFVSSANQHPTDSTYPYYVTAGSYESYRNRRINEVLRNDSSVTIDDMKKLHFDNFSLKAYESLPFMLEKVSSESTSDAENGILQILGNWDFNFDADSRAAVYYNMWFRKLYIKTWDEIRNSDVPLEYPTNASFINLMKNHSGLEFFDDRSTQEKESVNDLIVSSFQETVEELANWEEKNGVELNWSNYKSTFLLHNTRIDALGVYNIEAGGAGGDVVNASGRNHGPSQRIIIELDPKGVKAWGHYPGGQSGNPGSVYYDNMVDAWASGKYYDLLFLETTADTNERILFTQTLEPEHE